MNFTPILEDKPLQYAYDRALCYRNVARESKWGKPVYFVPSTNVYDEVGMGGPYYVYGKPSKKGQGKKGNCSWWVVGRYHEVSGIILKECIGNADGFLKKYKGRKSDTGYIGDKIQKGDIIVFSDSDVGHVIFVEDVKGNTLYISESAYSSKSIYEDKACITYTLDKTKFVVGSVVTLRPKLPYTEKVLGVMHTGDVFTDDATIKELKQQVKELTNTINQIHTLTAL